MVGCLCTPTYASNKIQKKIARLQYFGLTPTLQKAPNKIQKKIARLYT